MRDYVRETREAANRSIEFSRRAYDAAKRGTMEGEELLALAGWQESAEFARYVPVRDTCGAYRVMDKTTGALAVGRDGKLIPAASYGATWETCRAMN